MDLATRSSDERNNDEFLMESFKTDIQSASGSLLLCSIKSNFPESEITVR